MLPDDLDRPALLARWRILTRQTLPSMAQQHGWPIRLDHCFMRVCLDHAVGQRWDEVIRRPAIHHLDDAQLTRAVAVAERVVADPGLLPSLNRASLQMRRRLAR